ncbi:MAG: hypothetical protein OXE43_07305 [Chloroflexi bacterium]|nr:hypothetical protein [Chloroflexota bacterium]
MNQLDPEARDRAIAFVLERALPLDRALCRHHHLGGDMKGVLDEVAALQNPDGGFHGMEPDFQDEASSVLCTLRALEILWELGGGPDSVSARAVGKLRAAYVPGWRSWPLVPRHDNSAPHAPWWNWSEEFDEGWGFFADNPRPSVVATLHAFSRHVDAAFLKQMTEVVVERTAEVDAATVQKDAIECYIRFATGPAVPSAAREAVLARLPEFVEAALVTDTAQWGGYGLQPLDIVDEPSSPLYTPFREHIDRHLDHVVETQGEDGAWAPNWSWRGQFPEAWEQAEFAWKGVITVKRLRQLAAFGRVA